MGECILFLGGARSGKSRLALAAAEARDGPWRFVATAEALDGEMAERIARHRAERSEGWTTIEAPVAVADVVRGAEGVVLVDCLTLWLSSLMLGGHDVAAATDALIAAIGETRATVLLVSNEVGLGLVPETALGRAFRDEAGRLNQRVAAIATESYFVVAGRRLRLD